MSIIEKFLTKMKQDGVDHVRISPYGETRIGQLASANWRKVFFIPHVGEFTSPTCFANWLSTGDEEARHNPHYRCQVTVRGYRNFVLYAKFYQLCALRPELAKEMLDLPFASYKQHDSGIKEHDRWMEYPTQVKEMINHVIDPERGPKTPFPFDPEVIKRVQDRIALFVEAMKPVTPAATDEVAKKKKKKHKPRVNRQETVEELGQQLVSEEGAEMVAHNQDLAVAEPEQPQADTEQEQTALVEQAQETSETPAA